MRNIRESLIQLSDDEGVANALRVAQDWQTTLESMMEVASPEERDNVDALLTTVNQTIRYLLDESNASKFSNARYPHLTKCLELLSIENSKGGTAENGYKMPKSVSSDRLTLCEKQAALLSTEEKQMFIDSSGDSAEIVDELIHTRDCADLDIFLNEVFEGTVE